MGCQHSIMYKVKYVFNDLDLSSSCILITPAYLLKSHLARQQLVPQLSHVPDDATCVCVF